MAATAPRHARAFDPRDHERELVAILEDVARADELDDRALDRILKRHPRDGRGLFSRSQLLAGFRRFAPGRDWPMDEGELAARLRLRPVRTLSGVTPVTVLTRPHPCPGRCVFCPSDARMPKSYLSDEPGAQRAASHGFEPYDQTWSRLAAYRDIGHPVDKVELIVLGGTWSSYPEAYRVDFAARCLEALNDFGAGRDRRGARARADRPELPKSARGAYNRVVARGGPAEPAGEAVPWEALLRAQRENETAASRCVGLSVETRPDALSEAEVLHLRRIGATRVQVGLQHLSDRVLAANGRGHDVSDARRAVLRLRAAGFKVQAHWMANLVSSTPEEDVADFERLFSDPDFRPDELKLYPTSLVESAELMEHWERGSWRPYGDAELLGVVCACLRRTPPWCRLSRVIRDFSAHDIVTGNTVANLREVAERALHRAGTPCRDVRAREIRGEPVERAALRPSELRYETGVGEERFLQFTAPGDRLAAFLRLSLPRRDGFVDELRGSAVIREIHVYGASLSLGRREAGRAQHTGLGGELLARAADAARGAGFARLSVISAVGTRAWYRARGFRDGDLYQHRDLTQNSFIRSRGTGRGSELPK